MRSGSRGSPVPASSRPSDLVEKTPGGQVAEEVASIRAAAELAQDALAEILPGSGSGRCELEIAAALESALRRRGSEWHPVPDDRGVRARARRCRTRGRAREGGARRVAAARFRRPGRRLLRRPDPDGASSGHGPTSASARSTIWSSAAQDRALGGLRAGMTGREADALARDVIAARGFGESFGHSLGHGSGLEVHEAPTAGAHRGGAAAAGAVVTVEPGVYLPGWGGVRLEDDVHLAAAGPVRLIRWQDRTDRIDVTSCDSCDPGLDHGVYRRLQERAGPRDRRPAVPDGLFSAREAREGRGVRAHQAEEHSHRRGARPDVSTPASGSPMSGWSAGRSSSRTPTATSIISWTSRRSTTS